jgi:1-pyrroline-5-carboxylate dehydrogenase
MKVKPFRNERVLNFAQPKNAKLQKDAIEAVKKNLGKTYPLVVGGKQLRSNKKLISYNPSAPDMEIAKFHKGTKTQAERAINDAAKAFETWRYEKPQTRAKLLFKAAEIARRRRFEINAYMILEAGKNYREADADTAEAIDFLEFYGREALRYAKGQPLTKVPGEKNELEYIPLGVGVVIPPWNFPFAILVGMSSAAIVSGNAIVLKPSSDTPMMGRLFYEIMEEAGVPEGVLNFLPGSGGEVGDTLVAHKLTRFVAFTGSMEVGIHINGLAAKVQKGQIWLKRVVAEMGGKDAIIVDNECDINEAADGVAASAFGFQGQKCSACSRAIVHKSVYQKFVKALKERVEQIQVGPAEENHEMGAVINESSMKKIQQYMRIGKREGKLLTGGKRAKGDGWFLQPTVFTDIKRNHRLAQEEIFGPVLAVMKAKDFDDALDMMNDTIYGLTGAVYSRNRKKLEKAKKEAFIGNLYFNRKCTAALVGGHPFGGFNMSGTDSKAGGRDYLALFTQAKLISEKV